jgi:hypothetical protein
MSGKPNIAVLDGRGIIRRVFIGFITRERETQLVKLIEFLQREQEQSSQQSPRLRALPSL